MVCFSRFVYNVEPEKVENFLVNCKRFFNGIEWIVTRGDVSITSSDLDATIERLKGLGVGSYKFDTQRIWDSTSSSCSMPAVDWDRVTITEAQRKEYANVVDTIHNNEQSSRGGADAYYEDSLEGLEFNDILGVLKMVHLREPLTGVYLCPSTECAYLRRDGNFAMRIFKNSEGFRYTKGVDYLFDFDDGFISRWRGEMPQEFKDDFDEWVKDGCTGEPLKVRY